MSKKKLSVDATIISIPDESAPKAEVRIFHPVNAFKTKLYMLTGTIYTIIGIGIGLFYGFFWFIKETTSVEENSNEELPFWLEPEFLPDVLGIYLAIGLILIIITGLLVPKYVDSITYQVHGTEIVVFKGLINKTEKHVPFRTVTNISSRAGLYDRLLGIGCVFIETAGQSGTSRSPEEKIEGIRVYKEVRDYILKELRKFRSAYTVGTELEEFPSISTKKTKDSTITESNAILKELREIKQILQSINEK
ncbi:MAG: PH domain-containing protein [Candidatus Hodarchaeota archaeon]